jgi:glycosyltransferase involved in cell wall biosynthesis
MNVLFALPGLHRWDRGAEVAFISVANALANAGDDVTLIGSGPPRDATAYRYIRAASLDRSYFNRFPSLPFVRNEYAYEELTFAPALLAQYRPSDFDVTVTCSYPYTNWVLRRPAAGAKRPPHVFVTQNGDWPASHDDAEYRFFGCEGLVCTNPDFYERNRKNWNCALIPNGVDVARFTPGSPQRQAFGLPGDRMIVLMVSALVDFKRVVAGVEAVSRLPDAHLVVAGDGPLREKTLQRANELMPGRFTRLSAPASQMSDLYRSADVFLHMAFEESFGNVYVEALACGLPVVGHDSERLRWIVGDTGYLVDTNDGEAVASAITRAAQSGPADRAPRVARAAAFSWREVGAQYGAFLREVAKTAGAGRIRGSSKSGRSAAG